VIKRASRRRHLLFLSMSLAAHLLLVLAIVGVLLIVSDTPVTDSNRPLMVSLDQGEPPADAPAYETPHKDTAVPPKESGVPDTSAMKAPGDTDGSSDAIKAGGLGGVPGIGTADDGTNSAVLSDYIRSIRARINRNKQYPPAAAKDGVEGTVTVSFLLGRNGTVLFREIAVGSGHPALDEAALAAIRDSSPFPPFPDSLHRETLLLRLPINYKQR
jgi:periplasmic protein TonB